MTSQLMIISLFLFGYAAIAFEAFININKAASAIVTAVACWTVLILYSNNTKLTNSALDAHLSQISGILFFLLSAMTIVELIDMHNGFDMITQKIRTTNEKKFLWLIGFITFFLSSILDNLTTTIVMISLLNKVITDRNHRLLYVSIVVIGANAGGAWTPIGDVTTTMLWIGGQVTTVPIMTKLFLPSLVSLLIPLIYFTFTIKLSQNLFQSNFNKSLTAVGSTVRSKNVLLLGVSALLFVPVFKALTGLPPYIAILFGLAVLWMYTEYLNRKHKDGVKHTITDALQKIDTPTILFFLGILLSVAALGQSGILSIIANHGFEDSRLTVSALGLVSSVIDNVPLVHAVQEMYPVETSKGAMDLIIKYPSDNPFWHLLAYCAGTGGSILIIGSAAGVAAMGREKIDFFWYLKNISFITLLGYLAGIGIFILQNKLFWD